MISNLDLVSMIFVLTTTKIINCDGRFLLTEAGTCDRREWKVTINGGLIATVACAHHG